MSRPEHIHNILVVEDEWLIAIDIQMMIEDLGYHVVGPASSVAAAMSLIENRECHELCVSGLAHAGFRYNYALKRSSNMIAKWLRAANHSRTFRPPFSKLRIAR